MPIANKKRRALEDCARRLRIIAADLEQGSKASEENCGLYAFLALSRGRNALKCLDQAFEEVANANS